MIMVNWKRRRKNLHKSKNENNILKKLIHQKMINNSTKTKTME